MRPGERPAKNGAAPVPVGDLARSARTGSIWMTLTTLSLILAVLVSACGSGEAGKGKTSPTETPAETAVAGGSTSSSAVTPTMGNRSPGAAPSGDDSTVERVVDGDTIVVTGGIRVRLIGVDTPETKDPRKTVQCFGREAADHTSQLLAPGTKVRLVYDVERTDRYGRMLAYVYRLADGVFVNAALIRDGYAQVATFPPNVAHVEEFLELQRQARAAGRGLWSACSQDRTSQKAAGQPPTTVAPSPSVARCHPSYRGACIPADVSDADCAGGSGNGPYYVQERNIQVVGPDVYGLDADANGVGCER